MSEWWFVGLLIAIALSVSLILVYPLRQQGLARVLMPVILLLIFSGYYSWGGFTLWQHFIHQNDSQQLVQKILQSIKSPQELIDTLRAKLDNSPSSAKGWYFLGKVYSSQNDNKNALKSFATAYRLHPQEEQFAVYYAQSLWQNNQQQFNAQIINIFKQLLARNPKQPDALAMLAMHAFITHQDEEAINYWQRLLSLAPEQSEESLAIRQAIAKAQERINSGKKLQSNELDTIVM